MRKFQPLKSVITRMIAILTLAGAILVGVSFSYYSRDMILQDADERLLSAVKFSQHLIGKQYHDLIIDDQSVSSADYLRLVNQHDRLCRELGLQYIWSNLILPDRIVFTSATRMDVYDPSSPFADFYQQHNDPGAFLPAMGEAGQAVFSTFHNEWGEGRMVLLPHLDIHDRRFVLGASIQLDELNHLLFRATIVALVSGLLFLLSFGGATVFFVTRVTKDFSAIANAAVAMSDGNRQMTWPTTSLVEADNVCSTLKHYHQQLEQRLDDLVSSKRKDQLKNEVLTMLVKGESLQKILDTLVLLTEECDASIRASVLLYDTERECLVHASAPSLPDEYNALIRPGLPIGPEVGSCGSAAYLKQLVIAEDIQKSPNWIPYPDYIRITRKHQLLACWSLPILANDGRVLGTIANYSNKVGVPTPENLEILHWATEVATLAIEKIRSHAVITASEQKFRNLFDQSVDEIYLHDLDGKILDVNRAATTHSGYSREQLRNMYVFDLWPNDDHKNEAVAQWRSWAVGEGTQLEQQHVKSDGLLYPVDIHTNKIEYNNQQLILAILRDITLRKQTEEALQKSTESLKRNNADLLRLGEVMAHHFQESTRRMVTFARVLRDQPCLQQDPDSRQAVTFIDEQAARLSKLVRRVQRYLEIDESAPGETSAADVRTLIHQALSSSAAADADIDIATELPNIWLPPTRLNRILSVVFDNCGHYRRAHVPLVIQISTVKAPEQLELRIADNGSGIDLAHRDKVLELFTNLATGNYSGSGLALARRIMRLAGGDLRLDDGIDGGVSVVLTFKG